MAASEFNPEARLPNAENYLNYSRGVRDSVVGDALSGFAQTADTGLQALDRGVAQKAEDDVKAAVEDTDSQLLGVQSQPPRKDPLDNEVKSQVRNLEDKKLAMDAGTIDPQHYYATVQAKVKDIRARYAGYNDTIDTELKKIGIDPNWQRNQILEEGIRAQRARLGAAQEAAKNNREYAEQAFNNPKNIIDPQMRVDWANDPNWAQDPTNMKRLKLSVGQTNNIYSRAEMLKLDADTDTAINGNQAKKTATAYDTSLNTIFYAAAKNGGVYDLLNKALANVQNDTAQPNGVVSPEHEQALRQAYLKFRTYMEQGRSQVAAHFSDSPYNWSTEKKGVDDNFTARLNAIDTAISNKDWGAIHWNLANNEAMITSEQGRQLGSSQFMRSYSAMRKNAGDAGAAIIMNESPDVKEAFTKDLMNGLHSDQVSGQITSLNDMMRKCRDANISDPKCYKGLLDTSLKLIQSKDTKTVGRLSTFETMFSKENQGWWDNIMSNDKLSDADKRAYYRTLTSPRMQDSVKELGTIDRQAATKYYQYVNYMFGKLTQDSVSDINNIITSSNTQSITYDPDTNHLVLNSKESPDSTIFGGIFDSFRGGEDAVENWNQGIDALIPIWKEQGIDVDKAVQTYIERAGINLSATHQGNAIDDFINAKPVEGTGVVDVGKAIQEGVSPSKLGGTQGSGVAPQGNPNDRPVSGEDMAAKRAEALEIAREINKTEDPQDKAYLRGLLKSLGPFDNYDTLDPNTRAAVDAQYPPNPDIAGSSGSKLPPNETFDKWDARNGVDKYIEDHASGDLPNYIKQIQGEGIFWQGKDIGEPDRVVDPTDKSDYQKYLKMFSGGNKDFAKAMAWDYKGGAEKFKNDEAASMFAMMRYAQDPSDSNKQRIYDLLEKSKPTDVMNLGGPQPSPASTFQPRGNPAPGTPTDEQQAQGRDVIDAITGLPSFAEAVKKGDLKGAALAAATILPFPGGKILKAGEEGAKLLKGAGEVIDATTLEARRAAKGLDEAARGVPTPEELTKLSDDGLNTIRNVAQENLNSKGLSKAERQTLQDFMGTVDDELIRRNGVPYTPAMDKLEGLREEALTQKLNEIKTKGGTRTVLNPDGTITTSRLSPAEMSARVNTARINNRLDQIDGLLKTVKDDAKRKTLMTEFNKLNRQLDAIKSRSKFKVVEKE